MVNLTVLYWLGLSFIWHIPSITIEFGFHYYNGLYAGLLAFLLPPDQMVKITMNQKIVEGTELGLVLKQRQKGLKP